MKRGSIWGCTNTRTALPCSASLVWGQLPGRHCLPFPELTAVQAQGRGPVAHAPSAAFWLASLAQAGWDPPRLRSPGWGGAGQGHHGHSLAGSLLGSPPPTLYEKSSEVQGAVSRPPADLTAHFLLFPLRATRSSPSY